MRQAESREEWRRGLVGKYTVTSQQSRDQGMLITMIMIMIMKMKMDLINSDELSDHFSGLNIYCSRHRVLFDI